MLAEVRRFIKREQMLEPGQPVLVAVSGGVDSMVLLHVLRALDHPCTVAHVDHGLRGAESDGDRAFVEAHCQALGIPLHVVRVDPKEQAHEQGISVQMAARELRYAWFLELMKKQGQHMAMGHHQDDSIETLFLNLMRGTGVQGWAGIPPANGGFVRPLLCVDRAAIMAYATEHKVPFREDSSNADPKYLRNRVRNELLPLIEAMRPGARGAIARSIGLLRELEATGMERITEDLHGIDPLPTGPARVPFERIEGSSSPTLLLHQLLRPLGFHPDLLERIHEAITDRSTGALFTAGPWRVCVDRDALVIDRSQQVPSSIIIDPALPSQGTPPFHWTWMDGPVKERPKDMHTALLDADRLSFPIELRPWREGDRMRPIGLGGSKLISDILIDARVPRSAKEGVYVLVSNDEVAWLAGHRVGEGFQVTANSRHVLLIAHNK